MVSLGLSSVGAGFCLCASEQFQTERYAVVDVSGHGHAAVDDRAGPGLDARAFGNRHVDPDAYDVQWRAAAADLADAARAIGDRATAAPGRGARYMRVRRLTPAIKPSPWRLSGH